MANQILQWKALEFEHREKGFGWYVTYVIIVILLIAYEAYSRDYFAALSFFIIGGISLYFLGMIPAEVEITITDKGIRIDNSEIPYVNIRRFWIVDSPIAKNLHLETTAYLNRIIILQLGEMDSEDVRKTLARFLPEGVHNSESPAQRLARRLRF